jgi:hypothetical protein
VRTHTVSFIDNGDIPMHILEHVQSVVITRDLIHAANKQWMISERIAGRRQYLHIRIKLLKIKPELRTKLASLAKPPPKQGNAHAFRSRTHEHFLDV